MRSIKGYVQLVKIVLFVVGAIVIIAALSDRSPLLLLSGLGAISAVLLLVFKDTILSLVASMQIASNDMLRVGDWITMPQFNADGDVIDIALHTVKVQNLDKTITTIPTWRLISDSFKNWRGMQDAGARRIKRALYIDAGSVRSSTTRSVRTSSASACWATTSSASTRNWRNGTARWAIRARCPVNQRRLTNLGTFRAYAQAYLESHPHINHRADLHGARARSHAGRHADGDLLLHRHHRLGHIRGHPGRHLRPPDGDPARILAWRSSSSPAARTCASGSGGTRGKRRRSPGA